VIGLLSSIVKGPGAADRSLERILNPLTPAWLTVIASALLSLAGVYAIDLALRFDPSTPGLHPTATKQLVILGVAIVGCLVIAVPHYAFLRRPSWLALALVLGLLVFLLIPGVPTSIVRPRNGARAWIDLGFVDFQPSELAKIAVVLALAAYLRYRATHRKFLGLIPPAVIVFIPVALITLQPDLGTAGLFVPVLFAMLLAAGARLRHLGVIVVLAALAAPAAYPLLQPHQQERIHAQWLLIQGDRSTALDINYQSLTAQTLTGAGQVEGMEDDHARAVFRYNVLPERHNDFILAVVIARFGFLGGLAVLTLYAIWLAGALLTAILCDDAFGRLAVVGLAAVIAGQTLVNVAMSLGLLPVIGISLPYLSAGGTNLLVAWLMTGLVLNVGLRRPVAPYRPSFEYASEDSWPKEALLPMSTRRLRSRRSLLSRLLDG